MITFLHGFMGHPGDWDEIRASLGFESVALEIEPAADWQTSIQELTESVPQKTILVGYSMGARLALGIAMEAPQQCDALVLVSGSPGLESTDAREQRWLADQRVADRLESEPLESFLNAWYDQSVFASTSEKVRREEARRKLAHSSDNWPAILRTHSVARQPNYWPRLNELSQPILVIAGEDDEKYRKIAVRFKEQAPAANVTTKIIPDCGHIVHREQPQALVKIIRDFVTLT